MVYKLINYTLFQLFINYDVSHSPLLSYGTNQKVSLYDSSFSHFSSTVLRTSKLFHIERVLFSNIFDTPIKVENSQSSIKNKIFSSPLVVDSISNQISVITKCFFNNTLSKSGNGAIDINVYLVNISIDDCTFVGCKSIEKSGVFSIEFTNGYDDDQILDSYFYFLNVTGCCFYNCSTEEETRVATLICVSSYFTSLSCSSLLLSDNIVFQCGDTDLNGFISNAYLVVSLTNKIESKNNNFTQNEGNLLSIKSASFKPMISDTTIVGNRCRSFSTYFRFITNASPDIKNANIISNNFTGAIVFTSDSSVRVENVYFLNNLFLSFITRYEERNFGFVNCVFDFTPNFVNLDDSNVVIDDGNSTETAILSQKFESSCYVYSIENKKVSKSSWLTVGIFMVCGIVANIIIIVTLVIYLRKRRNLKFQTISDAPSGYDHIFE